MSMKADDRILSAARKAKGCPFQGSSRVPQPWQDLRASRALKTRLFGDRRFESLFLQRRVERTPESWGGVAEIHRSAPRYQQFESISLQQGATCEPDVRPAIPRPLAIPPAP